jgi:hypothetical protein
VYGGGIDGAAGVFARPRNDGGGCRKVRCPSGKTSARDGERKSLARSGRAKDE